MTSPISPLPDMVSLDTLPDAILVPPPAASSPEPFSVLALPSAVLTNLERLGYHTMTPIQAAALPVALDGHDLIAQARTGSGKTAAFGLALLPRLQLRRFDVQALVLCPTRELAEQVGQELRRLARAEDNIKILTLCGGAPIRPQAESLAHGAHVVVGTPGRVLDHLSRGSLQLASLTALVLDEADRMLDMGFFEDIAQVIGACPRVRQTLLFSATYPPGVVRLARQFMRQPQIIQLPEQHAEDTIRQRFYEVAPGQRLQAVGLLLRHYRPESTLAFCNTRQQCRDLVDVLTAEGVDALALHGELDQRERDQVMVRFANRSCSVLVATDVAARGLDIAGLAAVINVDMSPDPEVHVHRIGRTGRAGEEGWALSLVAPGDRNRVAAIIAAQGTQPVWESLDGLLDENPPPLQAPMVTLQILSGRKDKIRPGDVMGALTAGAGLAAGQIGRINVNDQSTYVAVERAAAAQALRGLSEGKIKGRKVRARRLEG
ncbi:ATP-dependent RNA helicase DbpA [Zoogloea sp.]|uniref:ATP-dependent RNA helicase DbpA n=1 Tax=Zoogloea sp. TaxID=49181 RepID=UPI0026390CE7|nr:ATP-dependent RNA helicase DbpA [Zoogloea sp.]MDD3352425.1 ATP-dependent RNA helicase DbpA [Zoogloea sp.]